MDNASLQRDRRLRRKLLEALYASRSAPLAGMSGRGLVESIDCPPHQGFEDEAHARGLLQDLVAKGLVHKFDRRTRRTQLFGLDYLFFEILSKGVSLIEETAPADPDIDDERNLAS